MLPRLGGEYHSPLLCPVRSAETVDRSIPASDYTPMTDALLEQVVERTMAFEGACGWLYLDTATPPRVTCGAGHALFGVESALLLPWRTGTQPAQTTQVRRDYLAIQTAPAGHTAPFYEPLTVCRLTDADIRGLCQLDIVTRLTTLRKHFPDLDFYPPGPQQALADLAFSLGPDFPPAWPLLSASVLSENWPEAAAQCHRRGISEQRNRVVAALFLAA